MERTLSLAYGGDTSTGTLADNCSIPNYIWPTYTSPSYSCSHTKDPGKVAFDLAKQLADKKLVSLKTVQDFITLMESILSVL